MSHLSSGASSFAASRGETKTILITNSVSFKDTAEPFFEKLGQFCFFTHSIRGRVFCSCYRGGWIPFKAVRVSSTRGPEVDRGDLRWNVNKARQERLASNEQCGPMVPTEAGMAAPWDSCVRAHNAQYVSLHQFFFKLFWPTTHFLHKKKIPWHTADQKY